jgi:hypothetical protein
MRTSSYVGPARGRAAELSEPQLGEHPGDAPGQLTRKLVQPVREVAKIP